MDVCEYGCCRDFPQLPRMKKSHRNYDRSSKSASSKSKGRFHAKLQGLAKSMNHYFIRGSKKSKSKINNARELPFMPGSSEYILPSPERSQPPGLHRTPVCENPYLEIDEVRGEGPPSPSLSPSGGSSSSPRGSPSSLGSFATRLFHRFSPPRSPPQGITTPLPGRQPPIPCPLTPTTPPGIVLEGEIFNSQETIYHSIHTEDLDHECIGAPPSPPPLRDNSSSLRARGARPKSDSELQKITPDLPQISQLKINIEVIEEESLNVHIKKAQSLAPGRSVCVKICLVPDTEYRTHCKTQHVYTNYNPSFDESFNIDLLSGDEAKRLLVSLYITDRNGLSELQGCVSFGVKSLLSRTTNVNGWYYLLTEDLGKKKHLAVPKQKQIKGRQRSRSEDNLGDISGSTSVGLPVQRQTCGSTESLKNIPEVNKDCMWMDSMTIVVKRGRHGYGFTVLGCSPVKVGRVEEGSPAAVAGLLKDDCVVKINGQNVSRSMADSVAKIVRQSDKQVILDIHRPGPDTRFEHSTPVPQRQPLQPINEYDEHRGPISSMSGNQLTYRSELIGKGETLQEVLSHREECRESGIDVGRRRAAKCLTKAEPQLTLAHQDLNSQELERQHAIQKLLTLSEDYINQMHFGLERYSRPLLQCIVSQAEHSTLFQNVEKLVTMSEFIAHKLSENSVSYSDLDNTAERYIDTVGGVFQPKIEMMAGSYESYCNGIKNAFRLLMDLREYSEFDEFIKNPGGLECGQCTIAGFIQKPLEHIKDLFLVLQKILVNTRLEHHDYLDLGVVVESLRNACNSINECNTRRSKSTLSLASSKCTVPSTPTNRTSPNTSRSSARSHSSDNSRSSDQSASSAHCSSSEHSPSGSSSKSCVSMHSSRSAGSMSTHSSHSGSLSHSDQSQGTARTAHTLGGQSVCSAVSISSIDTEVLDVQSRLRFRDNMPSFQLATPTRHMIYSGPLQQVHDRGTTNLWVVLMSDLLLLTTFEADEFLSVQEDPIILHNIINVESSRVHPSDFCLLIDYTTTHNASCPFGGSRIIMLRAPTVEQKCTWKNVLEQRVVSNKVQRDEMARADNIV